MNSYLIKDKSFYTYEFSENHLYWANEGYGDPVKDFFRFEVNSNNLQDLVSTFHSHIQYWEDPTKLDEPFLINGISEFILTQNNYPYEMQESCLNIYGDIGAIVAISEKEIVIAFEKRELHVNLLEISFLKDCIDNYECREDGMNVEFDENTIHFFSNEQKK